MLRRILAQRSNSCEPAPACHASLIVADFYREGIVTQAKERLLADWWRAAGERELRQVVMLAHRRADVVELNDGARALLRAQGRLGEDELVAGGRAFSSGDRVVCRHNDSALGVCNGTRASVRGVDPAHEVLTLQLDGGPLREIPTRYAAEHLDHGYALTGHAAQGLSIEQAFVLLRAEGALAEWGYVAVSRARADTRLYAVGPELADDTGLARAETGAAARRLAGALTRSAAEPSVVERIDRRPEAASPRQPAGKRLKHRIESQERALASTRAQLKDLGFVGRRRHGPALRAQQDRQERALADLRGRFRDIPTPEHYALTLAREGGTAALKVRELALRDPPERGMGLER